MEANSLDALSELICREYQARARYRAAVGRFGPREPFVYLADTSSDEVESLRQIYARRGVEPPPDRWLDHLAIPDTVPQLCREAIEEEIETARACDWLLGEVEDPIISRALREAEESCRFHRQPLLRRALETPKESR